MTRIKNKRVNYYKIGAKRVKRGKFQEKSWSDIRVRRRRTWRVFL